MRSTSRPTRTRTRNFKFETYDTYSWYLDLGPLSNINAKYLHGSIPYWNSIVEHPDYDSFWKDEAWVTQIKGAFVPNLNVAGFWDQEDPWGPWEIYRRSELSDPNRYNFIVAGPWFHGQWHNAESGIDRPDSFGGHDTAVEFREKIEAPWFRYWLHGKGDKFPWKASTFQTGSNSWKTYATWPPQPRATNLYLQANGSLSFDAPPAGDGFVQYISDPAHPGAVPRSVRFRRRIRPETGGDGKSPISDSWTGVRTWRRGSAAPLDDDLTVTGELAATLFASTSGTDSDFVVKLIDVYPENAQANKWDADAGPRAGRVCAVAQRLRAADCDGGPPRPLQQELRAPAAARGEPADRVRVPLRSHDHVFLKGHGSWCRCSRPGSR